MQRSVELNNIRLIILAEKEITLLLSKNIIYKSIHLLRNPSPRNLLAAIQYTWPTSVNSNLFLLYQEPLS